jgi:hypothetical protein
MGYLAESLNLCPSLLRCLGRLGTVSACPSSHILLHSLLSAVGMDISHLKILNMQVFTRKKRDWDFITLLKIFKCGHKLFLDVALGMGVENDRDFKRSGGLLEKIEN